MSRRLRRWLAHTIVLATIAFVSPAGITTAAGAEAALSPAELVESRRRLDRQTVAVRGEAIGETLRADSSHVWLNLLGDHTAVGVYLDRKLAGRVGTFGDYTHSGDRVLVRGIFNLACDQHGGELDVHATQLVVEHRGGSRYHPLHWWKGVAGALGLVVAGAGTLVLRRRRLSAE